MKTGILHRESSDANIQIENELCSKLDRSINENTHRKYSDGNLY